MAGGKPDRRCLLSSSVQDQQLMLQKKRFGDDCAGTPRSHSPDRRDDEMSDQDEPIPHAATMAAVGGVRKSMTQSPTAAELQFAMDRIRAVSAGRPRCGGHSELGGWV